MFQVLQILVISMASVFAQNYTNSTTPNMPPGISDLMYECTHNSSRQLSIVPRYTYDNIVCGNVNGVQHVYKATEMELMPELFLYDSTPGANGTDVYYTVILANPDNLLPITPIVHHIIGNVRGDDLFNGSLTNGTLLKSYKRPNPPLMWYNLNYVYLIYKQAKFEKFDDWNGMSSINFPIDYMTQQKNMTLYTSNYFVAEATWWTIIEFYFGWLRYEPVAPQNTNTDPGSGADTSNFGGSDTSNNDNYNSFFDFTENNADIWDCSNSWFPQNWDTCWADQSYQTCSGGNMQWAYDRTMEVGGNNKRAYDLYMAFKGGDCPRCDVSESDCKYSGAPKNTDTCWADEAYQYCSNNRQGAYDSVINKGGATVYAYCHYKDLVDSNCANLPVSS